MRGLAGKVALVAGGGSGIGAATAIRLAEEGAFVVVGDIDAGNAERVAAAIRQDGGKAAPIPFDIADEASVDELVTRSVEIFGGLDAVHVNAADLSSGTLGRDTDAEAVPLEVFDRTIAVNLRGHVLVTRRVLAELRARSGGAIVYTASAAAFTGGSGRVSYATAKSGLLALSRHVAHRWGKEGIRANVVSPGYVLTEGVLARANAISRQVLDLCAAPRLGQPKDIAAAVAYLLSDDAEWVTGQVLSVDGGTTMR
ncbi:MULTISPECIES: SDR family NAD(P)-dependent oxidoreductase [Pseudofrankia]|uniref:SDR family NAD(P)-dependent oxidoreductase n=1 Tax=Pseudofrankia TaxID=2994363 RepID=UPI000234B798|nr:MULTISPECIES: SDR family oxidoreductase [Pseudofrankia]OHV29007.1 oxidoreductase [Pseudofrankia sp. EUN1h]